MTPTEIDTYVAARSVLLDALGALEAHRAALVLIGAQAIYLHTGEVPGTGVATTTDGDIALDADLLSQDPELAVTLKKAHFMPGLNPGSWVAKNGIAVDLMVPLHQSGRTKPNARSARLTGHDSWSARPASGLEAALVDHSPIALTALEPGDTRSITLEVAGPAALLVAKLIKIQERAQQAQANPGRLKTKDAVDVLRLLMAIETTALLAGLARHAQHETAKAVTEKAIGYLSAQRASTEEDLLARLITTQLGEDAKAMVASYQALADDLLNAVAAANLGR